MPALSSHDEVFVDPDVVKVPESAPHSRTVDLLALAAELLLGDDVWIFRDLNWYPTDGGGPMAADVMVLPRSALDALPRSYRQAEVGGPVPSVVVEVASETDTFAALWAKARRYQRLGPVVYVVVLDGDPVVLRLGPDDGELVTWTERPIHELGGLSIGFVGGQAVATMPDGTTGSTGADLVATARQRAEAAEQRAEALEAQLRRLGAEPDERPRST